MNTMQHSIRRTLAVALAGIVACSASAHAMASPEDTTSPVIAINKAAETTPIKTNAIRGSISELDGSGGNIVVLTGKDGAFMVDAGIALSKDRLLPALHQLGVDKVKYLVNTHWHWDHTDGNPWVHELGATVISTPNTAKYVSQTTRVDDWNYTFPALAAGGRPTELLSKERTYQIDGETVLVKPIAPAHTDGDIVVYFKQADVLVLGDTFWNGIYPFIDNAHGGSIDGAIAAANEALAMCTDHTIVVPGHGPIGNRAQLMAFRDMLVGVRNNVAALKHQGKSLDQVLAAKPSAQYDPQWGQFVIGPAFFDRLVFQGLDRPGAHSPGQ
ncbi:MBL fold metallo-hydrolase [Dyella japonica]|uniref:Cyclase n=1 Tax=Dyella japonica DSM 16301 TaxID=1440762 RepID=A0A0G9HC04_9GAMM|nr:MBL fold metallo-hydrolase [Dyella japonica]KLD65202.1 cyclase [Dyella japonica DSM 16301]